MDFISNWVAEPWLALVSFSVLVLAAVKIVVRPDVERSGEPPSLAASGEAVEPHREERRRTCEATHKLRRNLTPFAAGSVYERRAMGLCHLGKPSYVDFSIEAGTTMKWLQTKLVPVLVAGLLGAPAVSTVRAAETEEQELSRAKVEIEVKAGNATIKFETQTLDLGEQGTFVVKKDEHQHELKARVEDAGDGRTVKIVIDYRRDDEKIAEGVQLQLGLGGKGAAAKAGKSKIKVKVSRGEPKPHRIDIPDGDDPLSGL